MRRLEKFIQSYVSVIVLSAVYWSTVTTLVAQQPVVRFEHLSVEHGLSQSSVMSILQDSKGYMWFGTLNGLNRYDGYSFTDYRHDPNDPATISNDQITVIFEDHADRLWVGTQSGLNHFDPRTVSFTRLLHDPTDPKTLSHNYITALYEDRSHVLWVGTANGLNRFDPKQRTFSKYTWNPNSAVGLSHNGITAIHEDARGELWVGTAGGGLNRFNSDRTRVKRYLRQNYNRTVAYYPDVIEQVKSFLASRGALVSILQITDSQDLIRKFRIEKKTHALVVAAGEALEDKFDFAWIEHEGATVWEMQTKSRHAGGDEKNRLQIETITLESGEYRLHYRSDDSHSFANWNRLPPDHPDFWGVQVLALSDSEEEIFQEKLSQVYRPSSVSANYIRTIHEDDKGRIWIGTNGGGLNRFDPQAETFAVFRNLSPQAVARYKPAALAAVDSLLSRNRRLAHLLSISDTQKLRKVFRINQTQEVCIVATGETSADERFDFGWLEREGAPVWEMTPAETRHAGGAPKNRIEVATATLEAGTYALHYQSDDSHAFGSWNAEPPDQPELWGIQVVEIARSDARKLENELAGIVIPEVIASDDIRDICQDQQGALWLATAQGLSRFNADEEPVSTYRHNSSVKSSLSANDLQSIYLDKTGIVWIGTILGGINKISPNKNRFSRFTHNPFVENTLNHPVVYSFMEDPDGLIWIGTWNGLSFFDPKVGEFLPVPKEYSALESLRASVMALHRDSHDKVWIGTNGAGLFEFDFNRKRVHHYKNESNNPASLAANAIYSILEDASGELWFGTFGGGLCRLDRSTEPDQPATFVRYQPHRNNASSLSDHSVRTIFEDSSGVFWIGTNRGGLNRFDRKKGSFRAFRHNPHDDKSLSHNSVSSIYEGAFPDLWVATYGGGLNRFDREKETFTRFTEKDGLPNNVIYGILPDSRGNLWLSSNRGLSRFDPNTLEFTNYDLDNGLQSHEFNTGAYFKRGTGEMLFGGINGFNYFRPDAVRDNPHLPEIVITCFKKFNETIWFENAISDLDEIELSYKDNFFSFEFSALDYTNPKKNQYAYKLEGFDRDWVTCGNRRFASYTNLDPGEYMFRVKGSNNDGVWNETGASVKVNILPPWWQTWWCRGLAGVTLLGLLIMSYSFRVRGIEEQKRKLESLVRVRTKELAEQTEKAVQAKATIEKQALELEEMDRIKSRFFTNISHEFRTPLTLIMGPLDRLLTNGHDEKLKGTFRTMRRNASRLLRLINQLLDLAQLENGRIALQRSEFDVVVFLSGVVGSFASLAEIKGLSLDFQANPANILGRFDRDKLEKMLSNLLSNAIKFTEAGGKVVVSVGIFQDDGRCLDGHGAQKAKTTLQLRVEDSGIGIPKEKLPRIFDRFYQASSKAADHEGTGIGLALTEELVRLHGGEIVVESEVGRGTEFTIRIPFVAASSANENTSEQDHSGDSAAPLAVQPRLATRVRKGAKGRNGQRRDVPLVLLVEDNEDVQRFIQEPLSESYRLMCARNGLEGLEKALETIPDLVISDVMMPEMDGYELCRYLKSDTRTCHIPIILLTAKAALDNKLQGLDLGADDYLTKPFDLKELETRARNLIEQRRKLREQFSRRILLEPREVAAVSLDEVFLQSVFQVLERHFVDPDFGAEALARELNLSSRQLQRKMRAVTDYSPAQFIRIMRLKRAKQLLQKRQGNVAEVAFAVGFNNLSYFSKCFREEFGVQPSKVVR